MLLHPETEAFSGDLRVLSRLIAKEHEAHTALGDAASLMGKYDVGAEEDEIRKVLAGKARLDDVVRETEAVKAENSIAGILARIMAGAASAPIASHGPTMTRPVTLPSIRLRWPSSGTR